LGGNQLLFLASCSLIFAVAEAPTMVAVKIHRLTLANPNFNEGLAGSTQTGMKEMDVLRETLWLACHEGSAVCNWVSQL